MNYLPPAVYNISREAKWCRTWHHDVDGLTEVGRLTDGTCYRRTAPGINDPGLFSYSSLIKALRSVQAEPISLAEARNFRAEHDGMWRIRPDVRSWAAASLLAGRLEETEWGVVTGSFQFPKQPRMNGSDYIVRLSPTGRLIVGSKLSGSRKPKKGKEIGSDYELDPKSPMAIHRIHYAGKEDRVNLAVDATRICTALLSILDAINGRISGQSNSSAT